MISISPFFRLFLFCLFLSAGTIALHGQRTSGTSDVPKTISYQGLLTEKDGTPLVDGAYDVTVTLYSDEAGTTQIWRETYTTTLKDGVFNLYLGSGGRSLPELTAMNAPLWIGTSVNGAEEMRPLTPLSASPYALNVPDRAITADKVDMDYISELRIDGQKVSGKGTVLNLQSTPTVPLTYDATTQSLMIGKASIETGQNADDEKGANALVGAPTLWSVNGDGYVFPGGGAGYTPGVGDWIGTRAPTIADFIVKVNSIQAMKFQITPGVPNVIGGDVGNSILGSQGSVIAEGAAQSMSNSHYSAISGGRNNAVSNGDNNTLAGGLSNAIKAGNANAIGGGELNEIHEGDYNIIAGGQENDVMVAVDYATIGGGFLNRIEGSTATIAGGDNNFISANSGGSFVGGGGNHQVNGVSQRSGIVGGESNLIDESEFSFIGGGTTNSINSSTRSVIGGGEGNSLNSTSPSATIAGGYVNYVANSPYAAIGGGIDNQVIDGDHNTVAGGTSNHIVDGNANIIAGGQNNLIDGSNYIAIGGGIANDVAAGSDAGTIAGGHDNAIGLNAEFASIGGGRENVAAGSYTTIPGGDLLTTNASYGQTAVGFYNAPRGAVGVRPNAATIAASNDPLFMVGNGSVPGTTRSNAFEVSYNGHTSVSGVNGITPPSITGGTYVDNVIYAWADVARSTVPGPVTLISDFGVASIVRIGLGVYDVTLNVTNPSGLATTLLNGSITANIIEDNVVTPYGCGIIVTSRMGSMGPNSFRVWTYNVILNSNCIAEDRAFTFKVTGRP